MMHVFSHRHYPLYHHNAVDRDSGHDSGKGVDWAHVSVDRAPIVTVVDGAYDDHRFECIDPWPMQTQTYCTGCPSWHEWMRTVVSGVDDDRHSHHWIGIVVQQWID